MPDGARAAIQTEDKLVLIDSRALIEGNVLIDSRCLKVPAQPIKTQGVSESMNG